MGVRRKIRSGAVRGRRRRLRFSMTIDVVTFGCRLNAYESEVIRRAAAAAGLADTVVVNTCAVTAEAVRQARQAIRKGRRGRAGGRGVVHPCAAHSGPDNFSPQAAGIRLPPA